MTLFAPLLGLWGPALDEAADARRQAWRRLALPKAKGVDARQGRFVVVDVETTGLNLARDHLISIAAVAIRGGRIRHDETFEAILRQETASAKDNILLHGIGGTAQVEGRPPVDALLEFLEFLGRDPLIAFHAAFDEGMIRKAVQRHLRCRFQHRWLDLAYLAPGMFPDLAYRYRSLDDWTGHFGIPNHARHNAMADAYATAQLALIVLDATVRRGILTLAGLLDLDRVQRVQQRYRV